MTKQQFDSMLAKLEAGKSEVGIGNIREITKLLKTIFGDKWTALVDNTTEDNLPPALQKKLAAYKKGAKKK